MRKTRTKKELPPALRANAEKLKRGESLHGGKKKPPNAKSKTNKKG